MRAKTLAAIILLAGYSLFMAFTLRGEGYEYPFPQNIGGQWLRLSGHVESGAPWYVRLAKSTNVYVAGGPAKTGSIEVGSWGTIQGSYGIGLQWKVRF